MGKKEEIIVRPAVGFIVGLAVTAVFVSFSKDIVTPILKQKSFDDEEKHFVFSLGGVRIHFGDVITNIVTAILIIGSMYIGLHVLERGKII